MNECTDDECKCESTEEEEFILPTEKITKKLTDYFTAAWGVVFVFLWAYFFGWIDWGFWWIISPIWIPIAFTVAIAGLWVILELTYMVLNKIKWELISLKERLNKKKVEKEEEDFDDTIPVGFLDDMEEDDDDEGDYIFSKEVDEQILVDMELDESE